VSGTYQVVVEAAGFNKFIHDRVELQINETRMVGTLFESTTKVGFRLSWSFPERSTIRKERPFPGRRSSNNEHEPRRFVFPQLQPDTYKLHVEAKGFKIYDLERVVLNATIKSLHLKQRQTESAERKGFKKPNDLAEFGDSHRSLNRSVAADQ